MNTHKLCIVFLLVIALLAVVNLIQQQKVSELKEIRKDHVSVIDSLELLKDEYNALLLKYTSTTYKLQDSYNRLQTAKQQIDSLMQNSISSLDIMKNEIESITNALITDTIPVDSTIYRIRYNKK